MIDLVVVQLVESSRIWWGNDHKGTKLCVHNEVRARNQTWLKEELPIWAWD